MKKFKIIFSVLCILLCVLPFLGMSFAKTDATTENRRLAQIPSLFSEGRINSEYLQELGAYFDDHYAFRNAMINADSLIQGGIFGVSNAETVIKGKNEWLYYSDTLDDYKSKARLSEKGINNAVRNISIMQAYVESKGIKFAITIAPNKNSLYGENMPYYCSGTYEQTKSINALEPLLKEKNISYTDLFTLFDSYDETLYLKRDSHWNNKGARLVYDCLMNELEINHNDYSTVKAVRKKTEIGDLNKMLYPMTAKPEWNYYYQIEDNFEYVTDTQSVEDAWIETKSNSSNGTLLMFRDSFGNTLLPFFAREFSNAYFSKGVPYLLESYIEQCNPDYIIVEKVERNIDEFAIDPPVITFEADYKISDSPESSDNATISVAEYEGNTDYLIISGNIDDNCMKPASDIYVQVGDKLYTAFSTSNENGDNGYRMYLKKDAVKDGSNISVIVSTNGQDNIVKTEKVVL